MSKSERLLRFTSQLEHPYFECKSEHLCRLKKYCIGPYTVRDPRKQVRTGFSWFFFSDADPHSFFADPNPDPALKLNFDLDLATQQMLICRRSRSSSHEKDKNTFCLSFYHLNFTSFGFRPPNFAGLIPNS